MAVVVMITIIALSIVLGAELGPKVDPTTTTYVPRPEWYFFFLFEVLRIIKPPSLVPLAAIGVPTICMILLFLLPFYDRSPERRPERRPIAMAAAFFTIAAMAFLTYEGAIAGSPNQIDMEAPASVMAGGADAIRAVRGRQAGRRAVRLPGLPQDRRERQHRPGPGPVGDRRAPAAPGDRAHARQPDGADAVVHRAARREARRPRRVPRAAEVTRAPRPASARDDRQGHAAGAAGAGDVRSHRRLLRRHELGHDGRPAPRLAPARGRPRRGRARRPRARRRDRHRRPRARARPPGRRRTARSSARTSPRRCSRTRGPKAPAAAGADHLRVGQRDGAAVRRRRVRRRDRRLRRAQLLRPRSRAARDGARRAPRRPRRRARDHDPDAPAAVDVLPPVVRPRRAGHRPRRRRSRGLRVPAQLGQALPRPARARREDGRLRHGRPLRADGGRHHRPARRHARR